MTRTPSWALAAVGAAALVISPAVADAHLSKPTGRSTPTPNFTVVEHALTDDEIPVVTGSSDAKGDPLTFTNPVYNSTDTRQIGHDEGFCMRLDPAAGVWECLWTTFLPGGQITVQGPFYDTRNSVLSVTGGTGIYRDVRGQMKLHAFDDSKKYDFSFQLS